MLLLGVVLFTSCNHDFDYIPEHKTPRWEYAPNMYHSEAYEPVTQVVDSSTQAYNTSPGNRGMNLREPVPGTIKRGFTPYKIPKDSLEYASATLVSPYAGSTEEQVLKDGELLYKRYCMHCHGAEGKGDGPVSQKFNGIANLTSDRLKAVTEGHIFHVITRGKGMMLSHASQVSPEERWKIAHYVKEKLQKAEQ
ncbi:MAG TPA: cytochrome c [Cytophagaceae bacterium]|nr:cytochrome c [Cytophagaceae bacterium]